MCSWNPRIRFMTIVDVEVSQRESLENDARRKLLWDPTAEVENNHS